MTTATMTPEVRTRLLSIGVATMMHAAVAAWLLGNVVTVKSGGELSPSSGQHIVMVSLLRSTGAPTAPLVTTTPLPKTADAGSQAPQQLRADLRAVPSLSSTSSASEATPPSGSTTGPADLAPTSAAAGSAALDPTQVQLFRDRLLAYIARYRRYPPDAQRDAVEGVVLLRFTMDRDGQVTAAWVGRSSGSSALDSEALSAIRRAAPLPPIPNGWPAHLDVSLPIVFALG